MRNYGINEEYITSKTIGNKENFLTYCKVLGTVFGNPLYHGSQVELKEFFNCEKEINEENAEAIRKNVMRIISPFDICCKRKRIFKERWVCADSDVLDYA